VTRATSTGGTGCGTAASMTAGRNEETTEGAADSSPVPQGRDRRQPPPAPCGLQQQRIVQAHPADVPAASGTSGAAKATRATAARMNRSHRLTESSG